MPACLVEQEHSVCARRNGLGDLNEMQVHRLGVAGRHHRSCSLALFRADGTENVVREDGAKVVRTHGDETGRLTLVAAYGDASIVEVYQLTLNAGGRGTLIWTNVKQLAGPAKVTRGAVFVSECSR